MLLRTKDAGPSTSLRSAQDDGELGIVLSHPGGKNKDVVSHPMDEDQNPYPWGPRGRGTQGLGTRCLGEGSSPCA